MEKTQITNKIIFNEPNVALKVEHLFCVYNEGTENQIVSLCDCNFALEKNKIHYIIGSSGCGKSTLVNHFNGLLRSKYGNVLVENNYKIGNDLFINDLLIGVLDHNNEDLKQHFLSTNLRHTNVYYVAFNSKYPKSLIKIIFEAYYKIKIKKVISLKTKHPSIAKFYYLIPVLDQYKINVIDTKSFDDINKICQKKIRKNSIIFKKHFKKIKIKKIKNLKKTVGVVFQFPEYQLFKDTILKDVMFGPINLGINKQKAQDDAIKWLNNLGINNSFLNRSPFDLSGGQKRRVAISGILAFDPDIIVFDEPTAGLDPSGEQEILNLIKNAKKDKKTVVVISHNMDHVLEVADNVIVMNDGEIIKIAQSYDIFTDDELLELTSLNKPKVIEVADQLAYQDHKFKKLYDYKPRTIEELADAIEKIIRI